MKPKGTMPTNPARKSSSTTLASDGIHGACRKRSAMKQVTVAARNNSESTARTMSALRLRLSDFAKEWNSPKPVRQRPASVPLGESTRIRIWIRCSLSGSRVAASMARLFLGLDQALHEPSLHQQHDHGGGKQCEHCGGHQQLPLDCPFPA